MCGRRGWRGCCDRWAARKTGLWDGRERRDRLTYERTGGQIYGSGEIEAYMKVSRGRRFKGQSLITGWVSLGGKNIEQEYISLKTRKQFTSAKKVLQEYLEKY